MGDMNQWNILVVEDEPDGQVVISGLLAYFNIGVDAVGTAEEALTSLTQNQYHGMVIDLNLPGMDGLQLVSLIRTQSDVSGIPCVAVTAYHSSAVKQQAINAGFDAYFAKPIDDTAFVRELSRLIGA